VKLRGVDIVAIILACGLVVAVVLLFAGVIVNISTHHNPTPTLGANTTLVLNTMFGGIIGLLGAYLGHSLKRRDDDRGE